MSIVDNLILIIEYLACACLVIIFAGLLVALIFLFVMMVIDLLDAIRNIF
jgi:hypothetical protein